MSPQTAHGSFTPAASPRVSVLMPIRNGAAYLKHCLASILAQTLEDHEVVVVDDASSDATPELLAAAQRENDRLRVVRLDSRSGIVGALNTGLSIARGELIARIDCDDIALPHRLELQVAYLDSHPEVIAVGGRIIFIDDDGDELGSPPPILGHEAIDAFHMTGIGGALCHGAAVMRREPVLAIGGYREEFSSAEDLDLFLRLADVGRLENLQATIQKVRFHARSHSLDTRGEQRRQSREAILEAHRRRGTSFDESRFNFPEPSVDTFGTEEFLARFALAHGRVRAARKHALRQLLRHPLATRSWRTLAASIRESLRTLLPWGTPSG